jgi:hypothetical protein
MLWPNEITAGFTEGDRHRMMHMRDLDVGSHLLEIIQSGSVDRVLRELRESRPSPACTSACARSMVYSSSLNSSLSPLLPTRHREPRAL